MKFTDICMVVAVVVRGGGGGSASLCSPSYPPHMASLQKVEGSILCKILLDQTGVKLLIFFGQGMNSNQQVIGKTWSCGTNWCFLFFINTSLHIICKSEIIEAMQGYMTQEIFLTLLSEMIKSQFLTHYILLVHRNDVHNVQNIPLKLLEVCFLW